MTKEKVKEILLSEPKQGAYMRHFTRIVRPFEQGLFEMEDTASEWSLIGSVDEAVDFLMNAKESVMENATRMIFERFYNNEIAQIIFEKRYNRKPELTRHDEMAMESIMLDIEYLYENLDRIDEKEN